MLRSQAPSLDDFGDEDDIIHNDYEKEMSLSFQSIASSMARDSKRAEVEPRVQSIKWSAL